MQLLGEAQLYQFDAFTVVMLPSICNCTRWYVFFSDALAKRMAHSLTLDKQRLEAWEVAFVVLMGLAAVTLRFELVFLLWLIIVSHCFLAPASARALAADRSAARALRRDLARISVLSLLVLMALVLGLLVLPRFFGFQAWPLEAAQQYARFLQVTPAAESAYSHYLGSGRAAEAVLTFLVLNGNAVASLILAMLFLPAYLRLAVFAVQGERVKGALLPGSAAVLLAILAYFLFLTAINDGSGLGLPGALGQVTAPAKYFLVAILHWLLFLLPFHIPAAFIARC